MVFWRVIPSFNCSVLCLYHWVIPSFDCSVPCLYHWVIPLFDCSVPCLYHWVIPLHTRTYTHTHADTRKHTHAHIHRNAHNRTHTHARTHEHTHTHTHIHTHTHTQTRTHTQTHIDFKTENGQHLRKESWEKKNDLLIKGRPKPISYLSEGKDSDVIIFIFGLVNFPPKILIFLLILFAFCTILTIHYSGLDLHVYQIIKRIGWSLREKTWNKARHKLLILLSKFP